MRHVHLKGTPSSDRVAASVLEVSNIFRPDLVLADLPPILGDTDTSELLPVFDGILIVADAMNTLPEHIAACEARLEGRTRVLGVVLNQALQAGPVPSQV